MPHKHKRRQKNEADDYDLPPTTIAKPLPVRRDNADSKKAAQKAKKAKGMKDTQSDYRDDTPREFARMMARFTQQSSNAASANAGSDEAQPQQQNRKRKRGNSTREGKDTVKSTAEAPKILPGERMSDFRARVDQLLPLSGISKKAGNAPATNSKDAAVRNLREDRQTKHERKLRRLQEGWRAEEAKIREREAERREEQEEADEEINDLWKVWEAEAGGSIRSKKNRSRSSNKGKKKRSNAIDGDDEDAESEDDGGDPWAKLNRKALSAQHKNPFDVVQAPPEKLVKPKEKFKVQGMGGAKVDVANVPAAAGSLRRREELASERKSIVEQYRKLMAGKRG